jgi:hypothetical protein
MMITLLVFGLTFSLALAGCGGQTNQQVIDQYKPQFTQLRADLRSLAETLSDLSKEKRVVQPLDPRPVYTAGAKEIQNTDILMFEHLLDPDVDLRANNQLDLTLSNFLLQYLRWTGPKNPMAASALKAGAPKERASEFEQALKIRYLGIAALLEYDPPVALSETAFTGGQAEILGFLVDKDSRTVLCAFRISASSNQEISYTYEEGDSKTQALERFAYSTLWSNARTAFVEKMSQMCDGDFRISK